MKLLGEIRKNARTQVNAGNTSGMSEVLKNSYVFNAAANLENLNYDPEMADKILEKICHKVGVTATEAETKTIDYL